MVVRRPIAGGERAALLATLIMTVRASTARCAHRHWAFRAMRSVTSLSRASARAAFSAMASTMAFNVPTVFGRLRLGGVIGPTRASCASFLLPFQLTDSLRRSALT